MMHLFVYGTLKQDLSNGWALRPWYLAKPREATLPGRMYWHELGLFPVVVYDPGSTNRVHGELLDVETSRDLWDVVNMEIRCGYDARYLHVQVGLREYEEALMFTWPRHSPLGPPIPGGVFTKEMDLIADLNQREENYGKHR